MMSVLMTLTLVTGSLAVSENYLFVKLLFVGMPHAIIGALPFFGIFDSVGNICVEI